MILQKTLKKNYMIILLNLRFVTFIFMTVILLLPGRVNSQSPRDYSENNEKAYLHLDKLVYVAGESIRYKLYIVDAAFPGQKPCSKIIYFSLTSARDKKVVSWRINLQGKSECGIFTLPAELKSGIYMLHAYTNWMRNGASESLYSQKLIILNLSEATPDTLMTFSARDTSKYLPSNAAPNKYELRLNSSKNSYTVNEKAQLEISLVNDNMDTVTANLSVSISAKTPFNDLLKEKDITNYFAGTNQIKDKSGTSANLSLNSRSRIDEMKSFPCAYRMEDKTFVLTGLIKRRKDNTLLVKGQILLSVIDSVSPKLIYARTDSAGRFIFYLNKMYDNRDLFLQVSGGLKNSDYMWEVDNKIVDANLLPKIPYSLPPEESTYLNTLKNIRLIDAVYSRQQVMSLSEGVMGNVNLFSPADMVIYPSDYLDLVNFKEIADNIIPKVKFAMSNNEYYIEILNSRTSQWNENNTVLLNGVPCTDLAYIATMGTKDIRRVEVISTNFLIGEMTIPGLVSIYTNDNKVPELYLKNNTFIFKNTVISPDTEDQIDAGSFTEMNTEHNPDFRSTLLWKPNLTINNKKNLRIEFPVSMLTGTFIIKVQGISTDGNPISASASFEVKE
jgi:hypothetical protein